MVTDVISPVVFHLELPDHWTIHNVFHGSLLSPYYETTKYGTNFVQQPPELIEGKEEYEVD
jgi:hypothetical protein